MNMENNIWNISLLKQFTQPNQDSPVGYGTVYGTIRSFSSIHHVYRVPPVYRYQEREFGRHPQRYEAGEQGGADAFLDLN